jgi:hypothetical protein
MYLRSYGSRPLDAILRHVHAPPIFKTYFPAIHINTRSRDSSVSITTGFGLDDRGVGVRVNIGSRIFSSPSRPDRLWSSLSSGYRGLFPRGQSGRGVKLTTDFYLMPRSRKCGSIHTLPHSPSWRIAYLVKHRDNFSLPYHINNDLQ